MINIDIYEADIKVASVKFQKQFMILVENGHLFWEVDEKTNAIDVGEVHIWIRYEADNGYKIVFVRNDWSLIIDGHKYPSGIYEDIKITNRHSFILKFQQFRFSPSLS